jgi:hypothetical protein
MEYVVKVSLLIIVIINLSDGFAYQRMNRQTEICGYHNGHRKYLELGESGKLTATNITVPNVRELIDFLAANWITCYRSRSKVSFVEVFQCFSFPSQYIQEVTKKFNQSLTVQCSLEIVTCPSCIIKVKFNYMNFLSNCENPKSGLGVCRCDHIVVSEPPYDSTPNLVHNCGHIFAYQSKTRSIQIKFVFWNNYSDGFQLEYSAHRKSTNIFYPFKGCSNISL